MPEPRVWYNPKEKRSNKFTPVNAWAPQSTNTGSASWGEPVGAWAQAAEQKAAKASVKTSQDMLMKAAETKIRHSPDMTGYTETEASGGSTGWAQMIGSAQKPNDLHGQMYNDDEIRAKLGLESDFNLDLIRNDPNFFKNNPAAEARMQQLGAEIKQGENDRAEKESNWASKTLGWVKDGLLDGAIKLGEAFELVWKPADMANEKLEKWFPEDATGTRKLWGNILGATPPFIFGQQEGGMPRVISPKQIQGFMQDSLADLPIGDEEQRDKYKARIIELKDEGMTDDDARIQAFQEREDIPGWVKFTLPIFSDPLTYVGGAGFVKSIGRGGVRAAKGFGTGVTAAKSGIKESHRIIVDAPEELGKILKTIHENPSNLPKAIVDKIDPSKMLGKLNPKSQEYAILSLKVAGAHGDEQGRRMAEFISQQMQGAHGKIDELFDARIKDPNKPIVSVRPDVTPTNPLLKGFDPQKLVKYGDEVDMAWGDVFTRFQIDEVTGRPNFMFSSKHAEKVRYIEDMQGIFKRFEIIAEEAGMNLDILGRLDDSFHYIGRKVLGKEGITLAAVSSQGAARVAAAGFTKTRMYDEMMEGIQAGYMYADPTETLASYANMFYRQLNGTRLEKFADEAGYLKANKASELYAPEFAARDAAKSVGDGLKGFQNKLGSYISVAGTKMHPATLLSAKRAFSPVIGDSSELAAKKVAVYEQLDDVLRFKRNDWEKARKAFSAGNRALPTGVSYDDLARLLREAKGTSKLPRDLGADDLRKALTVLNVSKTQANRLVNDMVEQMGKDVSKTRAAQLKALKKQVDEVVELQKPDVDGTAALVASRIKSVETGDAFKGEQMSKLFPGRIFTTGDAIDDARAASLELDKFFVQDAGGFLKNVSDVNAALRQFKTTFDLGAPLIQGLPLLFSNSAAWGKAVGLHVRALQTPAVRYKYVYDNAEKINDYIKYGMHLGSSEMTEAGMKQGLFAKLPLLAEKTAKKVGINAEDPSSYARRAAAGITKPITMLTGSFQNAFDTFLDVARIETMKGLEPVALAAYGGKNPHRAMSELAAFANKSTGVTSTRAMGVSVGQRNIEQAILMFSPRYTRAVAALFMDMSKGQLRGDLARKAIASVFMGQVMIHAAASAALNQEMNLMPGQGDFLKVRLGDTMVGFGGKPNSLVNMAVDVSEQAMENPEGYMSWKLWSSDTYNNNSFLKRVRYQMSPIGGEAINWLTGVDPIGRVLPDMDDVMSDPGEAFKYAKEKTFPFWLDAAFEGGDFSMQASIGEFGGAAAMPVFPRIIRDELRDELIEKEYGELGIETYDDLRKSNTFQSKYSFLVQKYPELKKANDDVDEAQKHFERGRERVLYQEAKSDIRMDLIEGVKESRDGQEVVTQQGYRQIASEFNMGFHGRRAGFMFRQGIRTANDVSSNRNRDLRKRFPNFISSQEEYWQGSDPINESQAATNELFDFLSSNEARDAFGNTNHLAVTQKKAQLEAKYGAEVAAEIDKNYMQRLKDTPDGVRLPQVVVDYYDSWLTLEPYWLAFEKVLTNPQDIQDWKVFSNASPGQKDLLRQNPKYTDLEEWVGEEQKYLREDNYEIDKALVRFYDMAPVNFQLQMEIEDKAYELAYGS